MLELRIVLAELLNIGPFATRDTSHAQQATSFFIHSKIGGMRLYLKIKSIISQEKNLYFTSLIKTAVPTSTRKWKKNMTSLEKLGPAGPA